MHLTGNSRISTLPGSSQIEKGQQKPSESWFTGVSATTFARGLGILGSWTFGNRMKPTNPYVWKLKIMINWEFSTRFTVPPPHLLDLALSYMVNLRKLGPMAHSPRTGDGKIFELRTHPPSLFSKQEILGSQPLPVLPRSRKDSKNLLNAGSPVYLTQLSLEDSESWVVGLFGNTMKPTTPYERKLKIWTNWEFSTQFMVPPPRLLYLALPHTINLWKLGPMAHCPRIGEGKILELQAHPPSLCSKQKILGSQPLPVLARSRKDSKNLMNTGSPVYLPQLSLEDSESWAVGLFGNKMNPTTPYEWKL